MLLHKFWYPLAVTMVSLQNLQELLPRGRFYHIESIPLKGILRSRLLNPIALVPELKKMSRLLSYLTLPPSCVPHHRLLTSVDKEPQIAM